jgi:hypothetical protein
MNLNFGGLLQQFLGGNQAPDAIDHFERVAQEATPDQLSQGLTAMFNSDQTPAFGQMAAQLFGQANPEQQAGMFNQLLIGAAPALGSLLGSEQGAGLGGVLSQFIQRGGGEGALSPEQAAQLTPAQVQAIAEHAEVHSPGIIEVMSRFYAQHPGLVKTLGSAALTIALAKIAERARA